MTFHLSFLFPLSSLASYLASEGSPTLCFDFRLCGNSFPPTTSSSTPTKGSSLSEEDRISALKAYPEVGFSYWAQRDYSSVCLYAFSELCKGRGLTVLGNSLGGHLAPIAIHTCIQKDPSFTVDRVLMQASINPYFAMNPNREATREFTHLMLEGLEEDGFMDCMKWSLGNNIPKQAGKDWMNSSLQPNYIGSLPFAREAFNNYRTDTLGLSFSDDGFVNGVRRKIDGFSRILGCADSIESEEEVQFWTSGKAGSMENGLPPDSLMHQSQQQKIDRNGWLNASMLLDPQLNGWVKGSTDLKEGEEDKRPRQIGHVDAYRPVVGMEGCKSREVWEVLRDFLQKGILPEQGDERLRGLGGRRDFGIRSEVKPRL